MKKTCVLLICIFVSVNLFSRICVTCDVIYEKSFAEWSDFYRRKIEFVSGAEMGLSLENRNKLFATIWYSQTKCSVIEMEYDGVLLQECIDKNFIFMYLGFDILNEGKVGIEINSDKSTKWRIYGKDENSLLIDPMFDIPPYDINTAIREKMRQGIVHERKRPKEETKYAGMDKGIIVWHKDPYFIVQTNTNYLILLRNTIYYWGGHADDGDLIMGHLKNKGETVVDNITKKELGMNTIVVFISEDYQSCAVWIHENLDSR